MNLPVDEYLRLMSIEAAKIEKIAHEKSMSSNVYQILSKDQTPMILKICFNPERYRRETYYLDRLKNQLPVPGIIERLEPVKERQGAILMQFLAGAPLSNAELSDDLSYQMGSHLARLHRLSAEKYGDLSLNGPPSEPIQELRLYFQESIEECQPVLPQSLLDKARKFFENNLPDPGQLDGPCIVHRDFKPGNIMADKCHIQGIIDWENARGSFAEEDFVQMDRLVWSEDARSKKPFLEGYAKIRPLPDIDPVLPLLRLCKALGAIGFTIRRGTWKTIHRATYEKNLEFLKNCVH